MLNTAGQRQLHSWWKIGSLVSVVHMRYTVNAKTHTEQWETRNTYATDEHIRDCISEIPGKTFLEREASNTANQSPVFVLETGEGK